MIMMFYLSDALCCVRFDGGCFCGCVVAAVKAHGGSDAGGMELSGELACVRCVELSCVELCCRVPRVSPSRDIDSIYVYTN